jgi:hypothetical protein
LINEFVEAIEDGPGSAGRATLYTGPRGAGKTVLLNAITAEQVRSHERYPSLWENPRADIYKSRLLGRILVQGCPPTRTRPPTVLAGPDWSVLPGDDPFAGNAEDAR